MKLEVCHLKCAEHAETAETVPLYSLGLDQKYFFINHPSKTDLRRRYFWYASIHE